MKERITRDALRRLRWPSSGKPATGVARGPTAPERALGDRLQLEQLAGLWVWVAYQPMRLRIGPGVFYTPDWMALGADGLLCAFECKARWSRKARKQSDLGAKEASRVRVRVAAERFPWIYFRLAVREPAGGLTFLDLPGTETTSSASTEHSRGE